MHKYMQVSMSENPMVIATTVDKREPKQRLVLDTHMSALIRDAK